MKRYSDSARLDSIDVDYVITAIGQTADTRLSADWPMPETVFVAGDLAANNHQSLIGAIGSGKKAAIAVRKKLENYAYDYEGQTALDNLKNERVGQRTFSTLLANSDINIDPQLIQEKLKPFNLHQTCERCNHCIDNFGCPSLHKLDGHVVVNQQSCIRCGLCIDVCPNDAIHWTEELAIEMLEIA